MDKIHSQLNSKLIAAKKIHEVSNAYKKLQNDEERVIFTLKLMVEHDVVPNSSGMPKSSDESKRLRELGNKMFVTNQIDGMKCLEVLKLYTKSIAYAPQSSQELALAYANRSAVLLKIHKYAECIEDIDRALKLDYPDHLKAKLYVRKTECLAVLKKTDVADCYKESLSWLEKLSMKDPNKEKLKIKLNSIYDGKRILVKQKIRKQKTVAHTVPALKSVNPEVPYASDAIAVKYSAKFGRHVVATRDIRPGELLAIERPYSLILTPDNIYTHCSHCLEVCWANIPCNQCTYAMYCSEDCKAANLAIFHDIECAVFPLLIALDFSKLDLFSLRLAIQAIREVNSWQELKVELREINECKDPRTKGFSKDGVFYSDEYRSLYSLTTNTEKRSVADLFQRSLDTCFILYFVATRTKMFGEMLKKDMLEMAKNEYVTFVGGLILTHQQSIPSNIHSFSEELGLECVERGVAAMPFFSLINHSCDPNIARHSRSNIMMIYSMYPIKKGEQIFDNYGFHYAIMPKETRQAKLMKQYYFICNCRPCREDWPLYFKLKSFQTLVKDPRDMQKIVKSLLKFNKYVDLATSGNVLDKPYIVDDLLNMIQVLYDHVPLPCEEMNNVVETLKRVYDLSGNRFIIPEV